MNSKKHKLPRRILAMLLAICMFVTMFPSAMFAVEKSGGDHSGSPSLQVTTGGDGVTSFSKTAERTSADTWNITMNVQPTEAIESIPMNVVLVLDTSYSMEDGVWSDGNYQGTRLQVVQGAAKNLLSQLAQAGNINAGVVGFAGGAWTQVQLQSLTNNSLSTFDTGINSLGYHSRTNITAGLRQATEMLQNASGERVVILLSDGEHNTGGTGPVNYAKNEMEDITVHTVGFAFDDENGTLSKIANETGGNYYNAKDADELASVFNTIANQIIAMVDDTVGTDVSIIDDAITSVPSGKIVVGNDNNGDNFSWNPVNNQALDKNNPLNISYQVQLNKSAEDLWENAQNGVAKVTLNQSATLTYRVDNVAKTPLTLSELTADVDLAKLTVFNQVDGQDPVPGTDDDQYTFVYPTGDENNYFSWVKPSESIDNAEYIDSELILPDGKSITLTENDIENFYVPESAGEYELIHHYGEELNGTAVTVQVVKDGQAVTDPKAYVDIIRSVGENDPYKNYTVSEPDADGVLTIDFNINRNPGDSFDCVDLNVALTETGQQYVLQGVEYNQFYGKKGADQVTPPADGHGYIIDNVAASSEKNIDCIIYLRSKYSVEYYLGTAELDADHYGGYYVDNTAYLAAGTDEDVKETTDPVEAQGASKWVSWKNDDAYETSISLKSPLPAVEGSNVTGWFLNGAGEALNSENPVQVAGVSDQAQDRVIKLVAKTTALAVTAIDKEVVTSENGLSESVQKAAKEAEVKYPSSDKKLTVTQGDNVTLLYMLTVTGDAGASFSITDNHDVQFVEVVGADITPSDTDKKVLNGELTDGTATIYVIVNYGSRETVGTETLSNVVTMGQEEDDPRATENVTVEVVPKVPEDVVIKGIQNAVTVTCNNDSVHGDQQSITYALGDVDNGYTRPEPDAISGNLENGYTYTITINKDAFIGKYDTDVEKAGHTPVSPPEDLTLTLTYDQEQWVGPTAPVGITVHCENPASIDGITKDVATREDIIDAGIDDKTYQTPTYGKVTINEGDSVTLLYKITVTGENATFRVADADTTFVTSLNDVEIEKNTQGEYVGTIDGKGKVTFFVSKTFSYDEIVEADFSLGNTATVYLGEEEEPKGSDPADDVSVDVTPNVPDEEDVKDLLEDGEVTMKCTANKNHTDESQPYDLLTPDPDSEADDYTYQVSEELGYDSENGYYTITVTVLPTQYFPLFDKATEKGHALDTDVEQDDSITLNFVNGQWALVDDANVTFYVVCDDDLTGIDKTVVTTGDAENAARNAGVAVDQYTILANTTDKVTVPENGNVTLLYAITVNGTSGSSFEVTDENAKLVDATINEAAQIKDGDEAGTFVGTIPDGSKWVTFYVSRTFTTSDLTEEDGSQYLINSVTLTGTNGTTGGGEDEDKVPGEVTTDIVSITPVDVTIYEGGESGYDGVADDEDNQDGTSANSLPHPIFKIDAPTDVNIENLVFVNGEKSWRVVSDGNDYYHFEEGVGQDRVRVTYSEILEDGTIGDPILNDAFDPEEVGDSYKKYQIALYAGDNEMADVKAKVNGTVYAIKVGTGELTVRAVAADDPTTVTNDVLETAPTTKQETTVAVEPTGGTTYTLNNTGVELPGDSNPALLFDDIINDEGTTNRSDMLEDKVDQRLDAEDGDLEYETKYLDLVDTNNGNAWIASSNGVDIYWDYPEGTDINTEFTLLHFTGLHRDEGNSGFNLEELGQINPMDEDVVENITITNTEQGIHFHVDNAGFSPFVLTWETDNGGSDNPGGGGGWTPDGGDDGPDGLNTEDHFSYIVGYAEDYRTGEPTDNEDLWPVKPNNQITRAEVATIFYRLLEDEVRDEYDTTVNDFSDVSADSWYNQTVSTLASMEIVKGYEDGSFRPNAPITRAEFGAIATRFFAETGATYVPGTFTDVTGDEWYANAIQDAVNLGLIGGYPDGTVRPNNNITRAEACAIVNRTLGRVPDADHLLPEDVMKVWPDNNPTDWFYADMQEATNGHEYAWIEEDGHEIEEWTNLLDKDWTDR